MTLEELQRAGAAHAELQRAYNDADILKGMTVSGIVVAPHDDPACSNGILLRPGNSGGGSITGIGYPPSLQEYMSKALAAWTESRIMDAKQRLADLGVEIA